MTVLPSINTKISVSDWINQALDSIQEDITVSDLSLNVPNLPDSLERKVYHLQKELQAQEHELNTRIDQLSQGLIQNVSKTQRELDGLNQTMGQLKLTVLSALDQMSLAVSEDTYFQNDTRSLHSDYEQSSEVRLKEQNNEDSEQYKIDRSENEAQRQAEKQQIFLYLVQLNRLRLNMEETRKTLKASERWYLLPSDLEIMLSSNDFEGAAHRLYEAKSILSHQLPQQRSSQKEKVIQEWQNKLEAALTSHVVTAIESSDKQQMLRLYQTFVKIDKGSEFLSFYHNLISKQFIKLFDDEFALDSVFSVTTTRSAAAHQQFSEKLETLLLTEIFGLIQNHLKMAQAVFPDATQVIHDVIGHVMDVMSVKLTKKLDSVCNSSSSSATPVSSTPSTNPNKSGPQPFIARGDALTKIMTAYNTVTRFCDAVESMLLQGSSNNNHLAFNLQKLYSKNAWGVLLCQPFLAYQESISDEMIVKSQDFMGQIFTFSSPDDIHDLISIIEERMPSVFKHLESLLSLCKSFTQFMSLPCWIKSVDYVFNRYAKSLNKLSVDLEQKIKNASSTGSIPQNEWNIFQTGLGVLALFMLFQQSKENWFSSIEKIYQNGCLRLKVMMNSNDSKVDGSNSGTQATDGNKQQEQNISSTATFRYSKLNNSILRQIVGENCLRKSLSPTLEFLDHSILEVQRSVFGILYGYMDALLRQLESSSIYMQDHSKQTNNSPYSLEIPQFSLSPSNIVSKIGEYLLTLPQHLDMFADHPAISFSLKTLPGWTLEEFELLKKEILLQDDEEEENLEAVNTINEQGVVELGPSKSTQDGDLSSAAPYFWLISIANCTMKDLVRVLIKIGQQNLLKKQRGLQHGDHSTPTSNTLPATLNQRNGSAPAFTTFGLKQLVTDIAYLMNVVNSMELDPLPKLQNLLKYLEEEDEKKLIDMKQEDEESVQMVCQWRGISI